MSFLARLPRKISLLNKNQQLFCCGAQKVLDMCFEMFKMEFVQRNI
jgi:iron-sulfur cluster repair protein YtfE (RIC family)